MTTRTTRVVESIIEVMKKWDGIDAVTCIESGDDIYDPYFFASFDVYTNGPIPDSKARESELREATMFESSAISTKDRFLLNELPVRLEYKDQLRFEELIAAAELGEPRFRDSGTYAFYRLANAEIVVKRSSWIEEVRKRIESLPKQFWRNLGEAQHDRAEHTFADLNAAATRGDELFFLVTSSRFIHAITAWVFAANHEFQPSDRLLLGRVAALEQLPQSFAARLEMFVRQDGTLSLDQRRELAEMLVTSLINFSIE